MSHKIKENMEDLLEKMEELSEEPISLRSAERLAIYHKAYKAMCDLYDRHDHSRGDVYKVDVSVADRSNSRFDRQMAKEWTAGMVNADGTRGPHWTMEETEKLRKQHGLECDPAEFWAVMNSLYSDYCETLRESAISTPDVYVRLAKAWIWDKDAVPDKAAAYYKYVVKH